MVLRNDEVEIGGSRLTRFMGAKKLLRRCTALGLLGLLMASHAAASSAFFAPRRETASCCKTRGSSCCKSHAKSVASGESFWAAKTDCPRRCNAATLVLLRVGLLYPADGGLRVAVALEKAPLLRSHDRLPSGPYFPPLYQRPPPSL